MGDFSIFVTVGTTKFEKLVGAVTSKDFLQVLVDQLAQRSSIGDRISVDSITLTIQLGKGEIHVPEAEKLRKTILEAWSDTNGNANAGAENSNDSNSNTKSAVNDDSSGGQIAEAGSGEGTVTVQKTLKGETSKKEKTLNLTVRWFRFTSEIDVHVGNASLVISHAGAGSILNALRKEKRLLVVVNEDLMNNHQRELADAMAEHDYILGVADLHNLPNAVASAVTFKGAGAVTPYPQADRSGFFKVIHEETGGYPTGMTML